MNEVFISAVIPVYNRPDEVEELLESLTKQSNTNFEVVIVEDGSKITCEKEVEKYKDTLDISYFSKHNEGPGLTRNYGAKRAKGNYIVYFDSDCIIPERYFEIVYNRLNTEFVDCYGGPDMAHPSFTNTQKAINYSMTSFLTTGGIRGSKKSLDKFHPRSFNMGYSKHVFDTTGGFSEMRFGEDIDMSYRILQGGFKTKLFPDAGVFHKRRTDLKKFFKQVFNSGVARINLSKRHPGTFKPVHALPGLFTAGLIVWIIASAFISPYMYLAVALLAVAFFFDSLVKNRNLVVAFLSIFASFGQLLGYGSGFLISFWRRIVLGRPEFHAFKKNFYK
jgi:glycosyltransferase involved in cell wall biosynthesis